MRRVKSRNFILMICGVFLFLIIGFAFGNFFVNLFREDKADVKRDKLINNVFVSSSEIRLVGNGNFFNKSPKVTGTEISDFDIFLKEKNDKVLYSLKICNNNNQDVYIESNSVNYVCRDEFGQHMSCENIFVDSYIRVGNKHMDVNELIMANSCFDFVIDAEYVGIEEKIVLVYIDKYSVDIK